MKYNKYNKVVFRSWFHVIKLATIFADRSTSGIIIMGYEYQFELDEDKNAVNLFRGIIKNKSELVKLLKQLGY